MEKIIRHTTGIFIITWLFCLSAHAQTDINWLRHIHSNQPRSADGLMKGISDSHYAVGFCVPAAELIFGLAKHDKPTLYNAIQTATGMGISAVVTYGIKHGINRDRPYVTYPDIIPQERYTSYSMPSGHTSFAFAAATSVSLQYPKWYVIAPAYLWAGAVGYSRLYIGVHYPSDVLVGAIVGTGSAFIAYKAQQWILKRKNKKVKGTAVE